MNVVRLKKDDAYKWLVEQIVNSVNLWNEGDNGDVYNDGENERFITDVCVACDYTYNELLDKQDVIVVFDKYLEKYVMSVGVKRVYMLTRTIGGKEEVTEDVVENLLLEYVTSFNNYLE